MPRSSPCWLVALFLVSDPAARALDQPPQKQEIPFETILNEKGLKLVGLSYLLKDAEERDRQMRAFAPLIEERDRLKEVFKKAEFEGTRHHTKMVPVASAPAGSGALNSVDDYERDREAKSEYESTKQIWDVFNNRNYAELRAYALLVEKTRSIWARISADPAVKEAIRRRNRDQKPRVVLGPVASREDYLAALRKDDLALLHEKGIAYDPKRKQFVLTAEHQIGALAFQTENLLVKLDATEKRASRGGTSKRDELLTKRTAALAALAGAPPGRKQQAIARLNLLDDQLKRLPPDNGGPDIDAQGRVAEVVALRRSFLTAVQELRKAVDAAPGIRLTVEGDADVRSTLQELLGKNTSIQFAGLSSYRQEVAKLAKLEKTVRAELIPCSIGANGQSLISVTLNSQQRVSMAIDPGARTTLLPAALAEAVGAVPAPGAPEVAIVLPGFAIGNQTVMARRARLRTVQLGALSIEGATCFVLPADAPGRAGPVLGTDVLDHFVSDRPAGGDALSLTQVIPALSREPNPITVTP